MLRATASKLMWRERTTAVVVGLAVIWALLMVGLLAPEAQAAPSTFTVNSTGDENDLDFPDPDGIFDGSSDGVCDVDAATPEDQCTLRAAIQETNVNGNPTELDRIEFEIGGPSATGVKSIIPDSVLPRTVEPVIIDGYSQPRSSANTLARGTNAKLRIALNGKNTITPSSRPPGLTITASNTVVQGLVINRFGGTGIAISADYDLVTNIKIQGNFIGTNPAGTLDRGNNTGVEFNAVTDSTVGGTSRASRNLISGNQLDGVFIQGGGDFSALGSADDNTVEGNLIGTQKDGVQPLGNGRSGVGLLHEAEGNRILSNSIFSNTEQGIALGFDGITPNDPQDTDTGENLLQNFPVIASAKTISGTTTIEGTLNSRPLELYTIQFFSSPSGDEGQRFIGSKVVSTDSLGNVTFGFSPSTAVAAGRQITATATRQATGDTSEFSAAQEVTAS
jgi:hypothetical protein